MAPMALLAGRITIVPTNALAIVIPSWQAYVLESRSVSPGRQTVRLDPNSQLQQITIRRSRIPYIQRKGVPMTTITTTAYTW